MQKEKVLILLSNSQHSKCLSLSLATWGYLDFNCRLPFPRSASSPCPSGLPPGVNDVGEHNTAFFHVHNTPAHTAKGTAALQWEGCYVFPSAPQGLASNSCAVKQVMCACLQSLLIGWACASSPWTMLLMAGHSSPWTALLMAGHSSPWTVLLMAGHRVVQMKGLVTDWV